MQAREVNTVTKAIKIVKTVSENNLCETRFTPIKVIRNDDLNKRAKVQRIKRLIL